MELRMHALYTCFWLCNQCARVSTPFSSSILDGHYVGLRYRLNRSMTPNQPITEGFSENHSPTSHRKLEYPSTPWYLPETAKVIPKVAYILRRYSMPSDCCSITIRCLFTFCRVQLFLTHLQITEYHNKPSGQPQTTQQITQVHP